MDPCLDQHIKNIFQVQVLMLDRPLRIWCIQPQYKRRSHTHTFLHSPFSTWHWIKNTQTKYKKKVIQWVSILSPTSLNLLDNLPFHIRLKAASEHLLKFSDPETPTHPVQTAHFRLKLCSARLVCQITIGKQINLTSCRRGLQYVILGLIAISRV